MAEPVYDLTITNGTLATHETMNGQYGHYGRALCGTG